jgi:SAM-dependent MidA family methyltransferase
MAAALYGEDGYYRRPELPIGPAGDFVTGSSLSPLFASTTARLVRRLDEALAAPADILEVGPGNGDHLRWLAEALAAGPARRIFACDPVARPLPAGVNRVASDDLPALRGLIFSYELFDALPVHRVIGRAGEPPGELWVAMETDGAFRWVVGELSDTRLAGWLSRRGVELAPGQVADLSLEWEPLYRRLAAALAGGLLVTCDYGFETAALFDPRVRRAGTLACYRGHRVHRDALRDVGRQDLTAHVDLAALREAGESEGLASLALLRQAPYLVAAGLFEDLAADPGGLRDARRLLDGEGMGEEIRVLVQARALAGRNDWIRNFEQLFKSPEKGSKTASSGSSHS